MSFNKTQIKRLDNIFQSLTLSGRPDILDDAAKNLTSIAYVDFSEDNFFLNKAKDHQKSIFLIGKRGTGKSTIFLNAIYELRKNKNFTGIYVNLQSCFEEIPINEKDQEQIKNMFLKNFFTSIFEEIKDAFKKNKLKSEHLQNLQDLIDHGTKTTHIHAKDIKIISDEENKLEAGLGIGQSTFSITGKFNALKKKNKKVVENFTEIISYDLILKNFLLEIEKILKKNSVMKLVMYLDDYSELNLEFQKIVNNIIINPIISSYNQKFIVKTATYPNRFYKGKIDATKIEFIDLSLHETNPSSPFLSKIKLSSDFIKRLLIKRLESYGLNLNLDDIFENDLETTLKHLYFASDNNPRALGFILSNCHLYDIKKKKKISIESIKSASKQYYLNQIKYDFENAARNKGSFNISLTHPELLDIKNELVKLARLQKQIIMSIKQKPEKEIEKLFLERKEKFHIKAISKLKISQIIENSISRKANAWVIPTSHFFVMKGESEKYLESLELAFIVHKVIEQGHLDGMGSTVAIYSLNYGLCINEKIDYGIGSDRKYRLQRIFDYSTFFEEKIINYSEIACSVNNCNLKTKKKNIIEIFFENGRVCPVCLKKNALRKEKKFNPIIQKEMKRNEKLKQKLKKLKIPPHYYDVIVYLRFNQDKYFKPKDLAVILDKSVRSMAGACRSLGLNKYIERHTDKAEFRYKNEFSSELFDR
jgi:hypothetical protein